MTSVVFSPLKTFITQSPPHSSGYNKPMMYGGTTDTELSQNPALEAPLLEDWRSSLEAGRYAQAEARYRALSLTGEADPDTLRALQSLLEWQKAIRAKKYVQGSRFLEDLSPLASLIALEPMRTGTAALLATDGKRIAEETELRNVLEPALTNPLTRAEALNQIGVLQALQEAPDRARESFQAALEGDAEHYRALTNLGNLLLEGGNAHAAEEYYRRALTLEPEYSVAHNNLAAALKKQKRVSESVRSLKQSQKLEQKKMRDDAREEMRGKVGGKALTDFFGSRTGQYLMIGVMVLLVYFLFLR